MLNPMAAEFFRYPSGMKIIFYKPSPGTDFLFNVYFWHGLFIFVFMFFRLRIEAPPPSAIYFFKAENHEIQFPFLCTKPSKDKHKFLSFKGR